MPLMLARRKPPIRVYGDASRAGKGLSGNRIVNEFFQGQNALARPVDCDPTIHQRCPAAAPPSVPLISAWAA